MPAIPCTEKFIAELAENENFPSKTLERASDICLEMSSDSKS